MDFLSARGERDDDDGMDEKQTSGLVLIVMI